jgi:adenine-specific DNA-methyltransferase
MSENRQILEEITNNFSTEKFTRFFRSKSRQYREINQSYQQYDDSDFKNATKLGEAEFSDGKLLVCAFEVQKSLSERSGKKAQYEKAKSILKSAENQIYSAGIFIFYDTNGIFRFSLVYDIPKANGRRDWNNYKRFTYFVSKEFTNKTFLQRVGDGDFSTLVKIKEAFSVEKVTKEFYQDIASWYFWAVSHCQFPKDAEAEENGRNIAVIRLITRMIFIWFMRERGLINKDLFEKQKIQDILKSLDNKESGYYTAILQNLFFAALSTKKEERQFSSEIRGHKGYNPDFGNQYVFRYQEMFKNPENIKDYFGNIPFLNGGLFECLDDKKNGIIIDGFSRTKKNQPKVPNLLFFGEEQKVDLNKAYGTKNKTYKVRGLLDILSSFNFTIDENSPDDADIALDPELLGRVFENLLASFNPETSTTARKATGSYYTPREIVDYMVTESLKAYFKTHLTDVEKIDEKLEQLFSNESSDNPFNESQSKKLVELIESVKIVDPAVGSGAFPMGALNKLVFILNKIDPGNKLWKEAQLKAADTIPDPSARRMAKERIEEFFEGKNADYGRKLYLIQRCIYGVDIQQIAVEIAKLRFFISLLVDEKIDKAKDNWGIEPLPNLDFKIMQGNSLISEFFGIDFDGNEKEIFQEREKIANEIKNIENEIKKREKFIVQSYNQNYQKDGSLILKVTDLQKKKKYLINQIKKSKNKVRGSKHKNDEELNNLIKKFEQKKIDFQNEADKDKKAKLKQKVEDLMIQIFETKVKKQRGDSFRQLKAIEENKFLKGLPEKAREEYIAKEKQKLSKKSGFDLENIEKQLREFTSKKKTRPFFPWKLYFAEVFEKGGFDVVIANPPYVSVKEISKEAKDIFSKKFFTGKGRFNLFTLFLEKSQKLLKANGVLTFILPEGLYSNVEYTHIRNYLLEKTTIIFISLFSERVFDAAVNTSIISLKNNEYTNREFPVFKDLSESITNLNQNSFKKLPFSLFSVNITDDIKNIIDKILNGFSDKVENALEIQQGIIYSGQKKGKVFSNDKINDNYKKILDGRDVLKWLINWRNKADNKYILYSNKLHRPREERLFLAEEKLVFPRKSAKIYGAYDDEQYYCLNTAYVCLSKTKDFSIKFILAILNSSLINYFYTKLFFGWQVTIPALNCVSLPSNNQKPIITLVDQILAITKSADYLQNSDKQAKVKEYEKQIDELVYKLYELTPEEIEIVEGKEK